jgi:hypothetical protein
MRQRFLVLSAVVLALAGASGATDIGWPIEFPTERGLITVYQPQLDSLNGDVLEGRAAFSFTPDGNTEPLFGAIWVKATLYTDRDTRTATLTALEIPNVKFADATEEQKQALSGFLEKEFMKLPISISIDRVVAALNTSSTESQGAGQFKNDPPRILISYEPAVLVTFDGDPIIRDVKGAEGTYRSVVNTPFPIVLDVKSDRYYLCGGDVWYAATDPMGPWSVTTNVSSEIMAMKPKEEQPTEEQSRASKDGAASKEMTPPKIVTAKGAAELISFVGQPTWKPIEGTDLLYASNTDSDIFKSIADQRTFVLLSGRWYASPSLDGPWAFVPPDKLPETFKKIPEQSPNGQVLGSVPGTELAKEAMLDAQIPQTATIKRSPVDLQVDYDGAPQFKAIEGTGLEYAVNTSYSVLKTGGRYYCCHQAVWYVAATPQGPWQVADSVPDGVYDIPPSNRNYNTTQVKVYGSTPEVVYVGYYPGYMGSYVYGGCVVYGTGWYYPPYISPYAYYPYHPTWGLHVGWNPYTGWGFGLSWSSGPFRISVGFGGWGGYSGWYGPGGYRPPYYRPYPGGGYNKPVFINNGNINIGSGSINQGGRNQINVNNNLYARGENAGRNATQPRAKNAGVGAGAGVAARPATGKANNVFADRNGDVYRRNSNGSWDKRGNGSWSREGAGANSGTRPSTGSGQGGASAEPRPAPGAGARPSAGAPSGLDHDFSARQRGSFRTNSYSGMRGGGSRGSSGGGGRRR